jgi:hypothetical protein
MAHLSLSILPRQRERSAWAHGEHGGCATLKYLNLHTHSVAYMQTYTRTQAVVGVTRFWLEHDCRNASSCKTTSPARGRRPPGPRSHNDHNHHDRRVSPSPTYLPRHCLQWWHCPPAICFVLLLSLYPTITRSRPPYHPGRRRTLHSPRAPPPDRGARQHPPVARTLDLARSYRRGLGRHGHEPHPFHGGAGAAATPGADIVLPHHSRYGKKSINREKSERRRKTDWLFGTREGSRSG